MLERVLQSAQQGDAGAQVMLGEMHDNGLGVEQDHAQAFAWYFKAAQQEFRLGERYQSGLGVEQDDAEAIQWYRKAAEQGDPMARLMMWAMQRALQD